jgi:hypothetical protein
MIIPFFPMRDDAVRTVLDSPAHDEISSAVEQIKGTPAEETRFPFLKIVARIETTVSMNEILIIHFVDSSLGNVVVDLDRSSGLGRYKLVYLPAFPSRYSS